jgi:hypothetical protein
MRLIHRLAAEDVGGGRAPIILGLWLCCRRQDSGQKAEIMGRLAEAVKSIAGGESLRIGLPLAGLQGFGRGGEYHEELHTATWKYLALRLAAIKFQRGGGRWWGVDIRRDQSQ